MKKQSNTAMRSTAGVLAGLCLSSVQARQNLDPANAREDQTLARNVRLPAAVKLAIQAGGIPEVARGTRIDDLRLGANFFTTPAAAFICAPDEAVVRVSLGSCTGEEAQTRIDGARAKDPASILVVSVAGKITIGKAPVCFGTRTCVLFQSGSQIVATPASSAPALVRIQDAELVSLATAAPADTGTPGVLDGTGTGIIGIQVLNSGKVISRTKVTNGLSAAQGRNTLLIQGVTIDLGAVNGHVGTKSVNGITAKQHAGPFIVRDCEIHDSGARGVWIHVTSRAHVLGSRFRGGGMMIDFDAFGTHSSALYNTLTGNNRHSAIFLEEGVKFNTAFANHCHDNESTAVAVHCQEVKGVTEKNTIACNLLEDNGKGKGKNGGADLGFSGAAPEKQSADNYAFNNRILRNHGRGAINIKAHTDGNYIAQSVIVDCPVVVANWSTMPASGSFAGSVGFTTPQR